jgi:hypothetical protein
MKFKITLFIALICQMTLFSQVFENGIGGYGYLEYQIMHSSKSRSNWIYGGGGLIVNKVFFSGLYYGSMINNFNTLELEPQEMFLFSNNITDSTVAFTNINCSDLGIQIGGVIWAEKPIQLSLSLKTGVFLSNYSEQIYGTVESKINATKPYFTASPDIKLSFMPNKLMKFQTGIGYKYVYYDNKYLKEEIYNGYRKNLFNSFYWSFSIIFGSF